MWGRAKCSALGSIESTQLSETPLLWCSWDLRKLSLVHIIRSWRPCLIFDFISRQWSESCTESEASRRHDRGMGSCCSKSSEDNFAGPGRQLGSTPAAGPDRASIPPLNKQKPKISGTGRTLGSNSGGGSTDDPRAAAARAAEVSPKLYKRTCDRAHTKGRSQERAAKSQPKGKLGEQLAAQKAQTRTDTLAEASAEVRGARIQGQNAADRAWN